MSLIVLQPSEKIKSTDSTNIINKVVICNKDVNFCDGYKHIKGNKYIVSKGDYSYFSLFLEKGEYSLINV